MRDQMDREFRAADQTDQTALPPRPPWPAPRDKATKSWRREPHPPAAHEGEAITKLVYRLIVGEIVERLQYQKITTSSQGLRPAEFLRSASHGTIAANYKRIVLFGETFIASVQIEKPSNLPGSEHENLESDLRGGGKRLFFEVP
jgi:hypothetical protein